MTTVYLDKRYRIWEACAEEDFRPALRGVWLDPAGWAVATNGFLMAIVPIRVDGGLSKGLIVPGEDLRVAVSLLPNVVEEIDIHIEDGQLRLGRLLSQVVSGAFPEWRKNLTTLRAAEVGVSSHFPFDPIQVKQLRDAIDGERLAPWWYLSGSQASVISGAGEAFGIVMSLWVTPQSPAEVLRPRALALFEAGVKETADGNSY